MRSIICVVFFLALSSSALDNNSKYWWLFPKFEENGSNSKENSSVAENNFNGTQVINLTANTSIELDVDIDEENDDVGEEGIGSGSSAIPKEHSNPDNKNKANKPIINKSDKDDEIVWTVDKDSKENLTDADATKPEGSDVLDEDNGTKVEENDYATDTEEAKPEKEILLAEKDVAVHVDGDAHPSSKLEQEERDDDEDELSGEKEEESDNPENPETDLISNEKDEVTDFDGDAHSSSKLERDEESDYGNTFDEEEKALEDDKSENPETDLILNEKDEAVHVDGDAHPSSKLEREEENDDEHAFGEEEKELEEDKSENLETDLIFNEKDEVVHVDGDAHPSSKLEQEGENFDESVSSEEKDVEEDQSENPESDLISNKKDEVVHVDGDTNPSLKLERKGRDDDENTFGEERDIEEDNPEHPSIALILNDKDETVHENENSQPLETLESEDFNSDQLLNLTNDNDKDYEIEDYVETNTVKEETEDLANNGDQQDLGSADIEKMPTAVPISPIAPVTPMFKTPACSFDQRPFNLTIQPVTAIHGQDGSDLSLMCQLIPLNNGTEPMPYFRLTWIFGKENCQKDESCMKVLTSQNYEKQNSSYSLPYSLTKLNNSLHTGLYICEAEIYSCQSPDLNVTQTNKALFLQVYIKPNYAFHIGLISAACVLLLALLAGLVVYARKVQNRSKSRYQELLASTDIQYYPSSKVLELPNSVYNPTTTGFTRMSASTFSSKSSFTSNEEEA